MVAAPVPLDVFAGLLLAGLPIGAGLFIPRLGGGVPLEVLFIGFFEEGEDRMSSQPSTWLTVLTWLSCSGLRSSSEPEPVVDSSKMILLRRRTWEMVISSGMITIL